MKAPKYTRALCIGRMALLAAAIPANSRDRLGNRVVINEELDFE